MCKRTIRFITSVICIGCCILSLHMSAQDLESMLSGNTAAQGFTVLKQNGDTLLTARGDGRMSLQGPLGLGTSSPSAMLHVAGTDGLLVTGGTINQGNIPMSGAGPRMMWYPGKRAFRSGFVTGTQWDDANIGWYSIAVGTNTLASGTASAAFGTEAVASGPESMAVGDSTIASGPCSLAVGWATVASGYHAIAMGQETTSTGYNSTAMGAATTASGTNSTSMGIWTTASGNCSTAMGNMTTASGYCSTAMGTFVSTNGKEGTFMIGDHSVSSLSSSLQASQDNRFYARFANGYALYSNDLASIGVKMDANQNSWSSISDSTRKEGFIPAEGESILRGFGSLRLGTWNYKEQNEQRYRHYGPMAQEWFAAFGNDGIGTIGDDTSLASADVDGVLCIAVQALEKRTTADHMQLDVHEKQIRSLQAQLNAKNEKIAELCDQVLELRASATAAVAALRDEIAVIQTNLQRKESDNAHRFQQLVKILDMLRQDGIIRDQRQALLLKAQLEQ